ncbi:MAG TPA: SDR family oxidoreductase [Terriglobia bacterium]|nr:SDR family oxidoreductase [Terriglobia bacterium]
MNRLKGKVAVITGGNSGIGLATAKEFKGEGARLAISGRDPKTLDEAARILGGDVLAVQADVTKLADIEKLFAAVRDKFGKVDVLFVNAGAGIFKTFDAVEETDFDTQMNINFKGAFFTIQRALPLLNDNSSIVLNASIAAHKGMAGTSVYSASKAALLSLVRTLSGELIGRGIRVNAVSPGPVRTPGPGRAGMSPDQMEGIREQVPIKRWGTAEEIAKTALFLASSDSSFIVGAEIVVDGGMIEL